MKLKIPVSKWLHGEEDVEKLFDGAKLGSMLHRPQDQKMCCIGIYLEACGISRSLLTDVGDPSDVRTDLPKQCLWLINILEDPNNEGYPHQTTNSKDTEDLIQENDNDAREEKIAEIFAKHDVEVEFIHD